MESFKLTISKCHDRVALIKAIKHLCNEYIGQDMWLGYAIRAVRDLPYVKHFNFADRNTFDLFLKDICDYQYSEVECFLSKHERKPFNYEHEMAKDWYNNLSKEDKNKVDLLIQMSVPRG